MTGLLSTNAGVSMRLGQVEELLGRLPGVPFFAKDRSLRYIAANEAMLHLCGCKRRSLIGRSARDVFPITLARHYEALDVRVLATARPLHNWLEAGRHADGSLAWLQFSRFPLYDSGRSICGVVAVARELPVSLRRKEAYRRLAEVARALQANPQEPLALRRRAREVGLSETQLERYFRAVFAVTPREFHARERLDLAVVLLRETAHIATVAYECGYTDHSAFSRKFRSIIGVTPRDYAKAVQRASRT